MIRNYNKKNLEQYAVQLENELGTIIKKCATRASAEEIEAAFKVFVSVCKGLLVRCKDDMAQAAAPVSPPKQAYVALLLPLDAAFDGMQLPPPTMAPPPPPTTAPPPPPSGATANTRHGKLTFFFCLEKRQNCTSSLTLIAESPRPAPIPLPSLAKSSGQPASVLCSCLFTSLIICSSSSLCLMSCRTPLRCHRRPRRARSPR